MFEFSVFFFIISYCDQTVLAQCLLSLLCIFYHFRLTQIFVNTYFTQNTVTSGAKLYVLQHYMRHQILHAYKKTLIFSLFGRRVRNYEVTGFKMRRILFGQFIRELQKFFPHPRSWECWLLRVQFPPNPRLTTVLLGQAKPSQSSNWGRRLARSASRRPPVC